MFPSAGRALVRRIEAASVALVAEFGQASTGAVERIAGGVAVYAGPESPATHAVGIGLDGPVTAEEFDRLEAFFRERGAPCMIDLAALADATVFDQVRARPYRIAELNYVLAATPAACPVTPAVRTCHDAALWAAVVARGFSEGAEPTAAAIETGSITPASMVRLIAEGDGEPAAAAALSCIGGVAWLYGDATLPRFRGRGLQAALIAARLDLAARAGCDLAAASVLPGSASHRNYERAGFQLVYTLVNIRRDWPALS